MLITDKNSLKQYVSSRCLWQGIPSIEVTKKGRTFLTFYSGGTREEIGNFVLLVKSDDGVHFGDPIAVCFKEDHRCYDPCLWIDPLERLWLTWSLCPDDGVYGVICDNPDAEELTFSEPFLIGHNVLMNKPTVLSTGEWAFPIAVWGEGIRVLPPAFDSHHAPGSFMYVTSDQGKTFRKLGSANVKQRVFDEHMFLEKEDGVIRVFVRTTYGIGAADSYDGGHNWGKDFNTGYGGPCSRFHIRRLPSGRVLMINHVDYTGRNNLTALLSEDDGKTFPYRLLLDERDNASYPDATVAADGSIHITYDRERGGFFSRFDDIMKQAREILTARITEEDILNGALIDPKSYLKRVAYKLTDYTGDLQNPFHEKERFSDSAYADFLCSTGKSADDIVSEILTAYQINCSNIHNLEAETFDRLIEQYKSTQELSVLNEIISLVRNAQSEDLYPQNSVVDQVCRYVIEHLEEDDTTESIAKALHFSVHYIRHVFKQQTGLSVTEFKTAQRLKKAKLLLRTTYDKIIDVAAACGFDNPSYFAEVFQRDVGLSPTEYRQQNAENAK